ncbi:hypothetical protein M413DRAFT_246593 [Hebeloma cylindrosporum]|uniref:Uncharacterized protein n=1 Tax=Hebeloma cylindrosporum TaxID=76867 RepID=A0A0C3BNB3_HEBCY|nr:hypothetical protein M413DRAFT_246593 [Hebeloma cylindrosporum h7]
MCLRIRTRRGDQMTIKISVIWPWRPSTQNLAPECRRSLGSLYSEESAFENKAQVRTKRTGTI